MPDLKQGIAHHQAGRLSEAQAVYLQILAANPNDPQALHLLGVIALQTGNPAQARDLIARSVEIRPNFPDALSNLALAQDALGDRASAIAALRKALAIRPDYPEAMANLAGLLRKESDPITAETLLRKALGLRPDFTNALIELGSALRDQNRADESIAFLARAIQLQPQNYEAHNNLGNSLQDVGRSEEAAKAYETASRLRPDLAEPLSNLGNVLSDLGQYDSSVAAHQRAIAVDPALAGAHYNLGFTHEGKGNVLLAEQSYRETLRLDPSLALAWRNLGNVLSDVARVDEAIAAWKKSIDLAPGRADLWGNYLFGIHYHPDYGGPAILREHAAWASRHVEPLKALIRPHANDRNPDRPLRIGYVSPDFRNHCASFFTIPLLANHDRRNFEIYCYADVARPDAVTRQIQSLARVWRNIFARSDEQVAQLIRQDQIDILIDLSMHMAYGRPLVFARKPAPVQISWLAYPGTSGNPAIDYRLTDPHLDPPGAHEDHYLEKSIRLPDTFWCYDPLSQEPAVNELPALKNGRITFGCLNNFGKITERTLAMWAGVLNATPESRLIILAQPGNHRQWALDALARHGIDPARIQFESKCPRTEYLALYHQIDIALDTYPYNGHTTSLDALWMGVPIVSLYGDTAVSRGGLSLLSNVGLAGLAVNTDEAFIKTAVGLAADLPRLQTLRAALRERLRASPLMDGPRFASNIEQIYRTVWKQWCATPA